MSKKSAVEAAIADIAAGATWRAAALKHGVQRSSISRAIERTANPRAICPCCGRAMPKAPAPSFPPTPG